MKKSAFLTVLCLLIPISSILAGVGIGYTVYDELLMVMYYEPNWEPDYFYVLAPTTAMQVLLPFRVGGHFIVEPTLGFTRYQTGDYHWNRFDLGCTLRKSLNLADRIPYLGFYANMIRTGEPPVVDLEVGPVMGGEYFLSDYFSLGVEGRLVLRQYDLDENPRDRTYVWTTRGIFSARVYF